MITLWLRDVRYACRLLRRQPAFSGVAILTLALGIGATTAVFTVVYGVLLRPLPYRDPARLMMVAPSDVVWLFVREGAALILVGVSAGVAGALAGGRWIATLLFGVTPADPATFAAAVFTLALTAAAATYLPARRAARIDPLVALRDE